MGIRKHLEQHKEEDQDLKLADLSSEFQESEKPRFDPETEITETELQSIREDLKQYEKGGRLHEYIKILYYLQIVSEKEEKTEYLEQCWSAINNHLQRYDKLSNLKKINLVQELVDTRIILPDQLSRALQQNPETAEKIWQSMKEDLQHIRQKPKTFNNTGSILETAFNILMLFPEKRSELELKEDDWQDVLEILDRERKENYVLFSTIAMYVKIVFPDKDLNLTDSDWKRMTEISEAYKKPTAGKSLGAFFRVASELTILSADKVHVTDQGLELEMFKPDFKQQKTKRPERKQF